MQQGDHMFSNKRRAHSSSNISSHSSSNLSSHSGPKSSSNIFSSVFSALPVLKHSQKTVLDHNLFLIHDCFSSQELSFQLPVHSTEIDPEGYMLRGRRSNRDAPKKVFDDFTSILSDIESGEGSSGVGESDDSDDEGMEDDGDSEDEDYETGRTSASKKSEYIYCPSLSVIISPHMHTYIRSSSYLSTVRMYVQHCMWQNLEETRKCAYVRTYLQIRTYTV